MMTRTEMAETRRGARPRARARSLSKESFRTRFEALLGNVGQVIKGKDEVIRLALTAMLAEGHVLFEDYPGTGKTILARAIAQTINAETNRIQCTPDLLPADITGAPVLERKSGDFIFRPGPVFANVFLADEINRATPKTQAALLEAMAERRVTVDGVTHDLPKPFFVLATENPIELAGTFSLPEAQLDRFLFKLSLGYPARSDELDVLKANLTHQAIDDLGPAVDRDEVLEMIQWASHVSISDPVLLYIIDLVAATRTDPALLMGASSRASQSLMRAARVVAASQGRDDVIPEDVRALVVPVLNHRLILTPDALLREETVEAVVERIVNRIKPPLLGRSSRD